MATINHPGIRTIALQPSHSPTAEPPVFDYRLVDTSVDALKFRAAASFQLPFVHSSGCDHAKNESGDNLLVVSPYTSRPHLLDLGSIDTPDRLFAIALTIMRPTRVDYATAPYPEAFNWAVILESLNKLAAEEQYHWKEKSFYVVVFKSQVPPTTDKLHLGRLDEVSHEEAMESGGLLK